MRILLLTIFLDVLAYSMIAPQLPLYVRNFADASTPAAALAGVLGAAYAALQLISGPLTGVLADRHGRRPVLLVCLSGTVVAFVLLANADSLPILFAAVLIDGLTGGNLTTAYAYISDLSKTSDRARHLALASAVFGFGVTLGPAAGAALDSVGISAPAAACAAALINLALAARWLPSVHSPNPTVDRRPGQNSASSFLNHCIHDRRLTGLLIAIFAANAAFAGLQSNFGLFSADRFAWTTAENGVFFAFVGACAVVTQGFLLRIVQKRIPARPLIGSGLLLLACGLAGIAINHNAAILFPLAAIAAAGSGASLPTITAVAVDRLAVDRRGLFMGLTQSLTAAANIVAPLLAGASYQWIAPEAPYLLGALFASWAAIAAMIALKEGDSVRT